MGRKYQFISADGHLETPPDPWVKYVPERYRDRAPRLIHLPDGGGDAWVVEGMELLHTGQNIKAGGQVRFAHGTYTNADGSPVEGTGGPVQRLLEQDKDGIDAEVLFPPIFATGFVQGIKDHEVYIAMIQAYNTFLGEEYCAVAPDRLIGNAFIPVSGVDDAIAELERAHRMGLKSVTFRQFPNGSGSPTDEDDRFWEKSLELGMALAPHAVFGDLAGPHPRGPNPSDTKVAGGMSQHCAGFTPAYALAQMIVARVFDRFPDLQFYFAEVNAAMIPGMLYYMDRDYAEYNSWFQFSLDRRPSEIVLDHTYFGMVQEHLAVGMGKAGLLPLERFMWGSDFPHSVGTFPHSRKYLSEVFGGVDEGVTRRVLLENPAQFFGLDLSADITDTPEGA
jgi:predicted TIM-barrel fold metal-dependent hydrolase